MLIIIDNVLSATELHIDLLANCFLNKIWSDLTRELVCLTSDLSRQVIFHGSTVIPHSVYLVYLSVT